jgi:hypothetical protein
MKMEETSSFFRQVSSMQKSILKILDVNSLFVCIVNVLPFSLSLRMGIKQMNLF